MRRRAPQCLLAIASLAIACDDGGAYDVVIQLEPATLAADVVRIEVALVPGGCGGVVLGDRAPAAAIAATYRRSEARMPLGAIDAGAYGLYARGLAADCRAIAAGCADVTIEAGGSGTLGVVARAIDGSGCPATAICSDGVCVAGDAGADAADAATADAGDGGSDDAGVDATIDDGGFDAGPDDAGMDAGPIDAGCECMPGTTAPCVGGCNMRGTRSCSAACTWSACATAPSADTVALYSFDGEMRARAFTDRAGMHDGTMVGGDALWAPGPRSCGDALLTAGVSTIWGEVPDSPDWDLATGSVDLWAYFATTGEMGVLSRDASGTALPGHFTIVRRATGLLEVRIQTAAGEAMRCVSVRNARWYEIGVRFGGSAFDVVVDGMPIDATATCTGATTEGIAGNDNPWVVGALSWTSMEGLATPTSGPLNGRVDHVAIRDTRATAAAPRLVSLVLVDAADDSSLGPLADGDVLDLATLPPINVRATTDPGRVGSVVFALDGTTFAIEYQPPYVMAGDDPTGNYNPLTLPPGDHVIRATPYTGSGGTGTAGTPLEVAVTVR